MNRELDAIVEIVAIGIEGQGEFTVVLDVCCEVIHKTELGEIELEVDAACFATDGVRPGADGDALVAKVIASGLVVVIGFDSEGSGIEEPDLENVVVFLCPVVDVFDFERSVSDALVAWDIESDAPTDGVVMVKIVEVFTCRLEGEGGGLTEGTEGEKSCEGEKFHLACEGDSHGGGQTGCSLRRL